MGVTFEQERRNVGSGWHPLVDGVHNDLTHLLGDYTLWQIKEKFGGLRYYMAPLAGCSPRLVEKTRDIITEAEEKSFTICEHCGGEPAEPSSDGLGWIKTLCEQHHAERKATITQQGAWSC